MNRLLRIHEQYWQADLVKVFKQTTREVVATVRLTGEIGASYVRPGLRDRLRALIVRRFRTTALGFGDFVFSDVKSCGLVLEKKGFYDFFVTAVESWIIARSLDKATSIAANYFGQVEEVIQDAFREGLGQEEAARRIRSVVGYAFEGYAAARIARTESHTAANLGMEEAVRSTDLRFDREWMSAEDSRTRPAHASADGQMVSQDEPFLVGGEALMFPGDPAGSAKQVINCRCVVAYHPRV